MSPPTLLAARAIEALRDLLELARIEMAKAFGNEPPPSVQRVLAYWLARAWEAGVEYQKSRSSEDGHRLDSEQ